MSIKQYESELIWDLQRLMRIDSVKNTAEAKSRQPFGRGIADALEFTLKRAEEFGFNTVNVDGYAGRVEWGNGPKDEIGILGHLDVVPVGEGWTHPPFEARIEDGKIFGRGAVDDKGPVMAALYAMRALKESGITPQKKVVLILGCDEESGWECMDYYDSCYKMPLMGFTPDAEFPLINCEKGIFHVQYELPLPKSEKVQIKELFGGDRVNVVPEKAHLEVLADGTLYTTNAEGTRGHGSTPELASNALWTVFKELSEIFEKTGEYSPLQMLYKLIACDYDGSGMGIKMSDEESGPLTMNLGLAEIRGDKLIIGLDIRYPATKRQSDVEPVVEAKLRALFGDINKIWEKCQKPHLVSKDSPLVTMLLGAYEKVTGTRGEAFAIGGGTYAKAMSNCVAFGPNFPGQENMVHKTNEYITVENLLKITEIYREALARLLEL